eukprot:1195610-Prorocentrum_minimum.AAC.2
MFPVRSRMANVACWPTVNSNRSERHLCSPATSVCLVGRTLAIGHPLPAKNGFMLFIATCGSWVKTSTWNTPGPVEMAHDLGSVPSLWTPLI